jgi:hypothetical protein
MAADQAQEVTTIAVGPIQHGGDAESAVDHGLDGDGWEAGMLTVIGRRAKPEQMVALTGVGCVPPLRALQAADQRLSRSRMKYSGWPVYSFSDTGIGNTPCHMQSISSS